MTKSQMERASYLSAKEAEEPLTPEEEKELAYLEQLDEELTRELSYHW